METFIKIILLAGIEALPLGGARNMRNEAVITIGTCVVVAVLLHFVAP
ncbi:MAG: hypothetical protein V4517_08230 [Pseudomonadota bacterium]